MASVDLLAEASRLRAKGLTLAETAASLAQYVPNALIAWRFANGWTCPAVARLWNEHFPDLPVSDQVIAGWERGLFSRRYATPSILRLFLLARIYGCEPADLLAGVRLPDWYVPASGVPVEDAELASLAKTVITPGATTRDNAVRICAVIGVAGLTAWRLAHRLTRERVAGLWRQKWPHAPISAVEVRRWEEAYDSGVGYGPMPLPQLAQLYKCLPSDLLMGVGTEWTVRSGQLRSEEQ